MPKFIRYVVESREQKVRYTIEADDEAEADRKAETGDTVGEATVGGWNVVNREIVGADD